MSAVSLVRVLFCGGLVIPTGCLVCWSDTLNTARNCSSCNNLMMLHYWHKMEFCSLLKHIAVFRFAVETWRGCYSVCVEAEPLQELSLWESTECESECCTEAYCRGREDSRGGRQSVCHPVIHVVVIACTTIHLTAHSCRACGIGNSLIVLLLYHRQ